MPDANNTPHNWPYRWYILALAALTSTFVAAVPFSAMPPLFKEISDDIGLNEVQIGAVWGAASLAGVFLSVFAGLLGDRFGFKRILIISCLLVGITGAARGLSDSFVSLGITVFIYGIARVIVPISVMKAISLWFKGRNFGMANGVSAMGMGLGLMLGPLISATFMSPLLGGWRNVMYVYGAISAGFAVLWAVFGRSPTQGATEPHTHVPFREAFSKLVRVRAVWLVGLTLMFRMSGIQGMTGYLPLYMRERGWPEAAADGTLSVFYAVSTVCVVALATLSDRTGLRKPFLFTAIVVMTVALGLLPLVDGAPVWVLMVLAGIFMDGFMSIIMTTLLETEGVGLAYSGTALGMVFTIAQLGGVLSPPLGNSFARIDPGLPFVFWAALSAVALVAVAFIKETGTRRKRAIS